MISYEEETCLLLHVLLGKVEAIYAWLNSSQGQATIQRYNLTISAAPMDEGRVYSTVLQELADMLHHSATGGIEDFSDYAAAVDDQASSPYETTAAGYPFIERAKFFLVTIANPTLCAFGVIGNAFNVLVLSGGRLQSSIDCSVERTAHTALVALAVSDTLYCLATLAVSTLGGRSEIAYDDFGVRLCVKLYGPYVQNLLQHAGTWLTVVMAAGRYAAICRPLQARHLVDVKATRIAIAAAFLLAGLINVPRIWTYSLIELRCPPTVGSLVYYVLDEGYFVAQRRLKTASTFVCAFLGFFLPVAILVYCNVHLIRALRQSTELRRRFRVFPKQTSPTSSSIRINLTLIAIICMYVLFVSPSEMLHFFYYAVSGSDVEVFNLTIVVTNLLQTANFAFNFVLYCVVNVHFRQTCIALVLCKLGSKNKEGGGLGARGRAGSIGGGGSQSALRPCGRISSFSYVAIPTKPSLTASPCETAV